MSTNPYEISGQVPQLRRSVFVMMDILGYTEAIIQSRKLGNEARVLEDLHRILSEGREWLDEKNERSGLPSISEKKGYAIKAFTDNIVMGWPIFDDAESELGTAFFKLCKFQFDMVTSGYFVRGAISIGDAYIDEIAVFGEALTDAYDGEQRLARDPRIILTNTAVVAAKSHLRYYGDGHGAPHVRNLIRDADGRWFLNYLDWVLIAEDETGPFYEDFLKHKNVVEAKLREFESEPRIWSKYAWVATYHNYFCDMHPEYFYEEHRIKFDRFSTPMFSIL